MDSPDGAGGEGLRLTDPTHNQLAVAEQCAEQCTEKLFRQEEEEFKTFVSWLQVVLWQTPTENITISD